MNESSNGCLKLNELNNEGCCLFTPMTHTVALPHRAPACCRFGEVHPVGTSGVFRPRSRFASRLLLFPQSLSHRQSRFGLCSDRSRQTVDRHHNSSPCRSLNDQQYGRTPFRSVEGRDHQDARSDPGINSLALRKDGMDSGKPRDSGIKASDELCLRPTPGSLMPQARTHPDLLMTS